MNKEVVVGSSSGTTTNIIKSDGGGGGGGGGGVAVVPRRRLQPSEKQLKQQSQQNHPQRQKSFSTQTIMAGLYDLEETLGKGHFATVKAAKHVFTGERVAVKVIDKTKLDTISQKALLKEVLCMKLVQHPNVVKLYEVIDTSSKMYLVLELGQGDLYDLILRQQGGLPEQIARVYFTQILTAVSYCHKLHVAHRDLKPENVVFFPTEQSQSGCGLTTTSSTTITTPSPSSSSLSQQQVCPILGQVKLTDFGFSNKFCPGVNLDTSCGSLAYSAPEILLGDSYDAPAVDIWSLGVILYMLVCGRAPFQEANDSETLIMIMDVKYSIPEGLSSPLKDLIRRMLVRDPGKRARLDEIEAHEWVKEGRVGDDARGRPRNTYPLIAYNSLSEAESERICGEMVKGGIIASYEQVKTSLRSNAYNHVTSTYYLLAERLLREKAAQAGESGEDKDPSRNPSPTPCSSSSPPMIIRRKNSHQFEDVVLPSTLPRGDGGQPEVSCTSMSQSSSSCSPSSPSSQKSSIAGLDLETGASRQRKSQSQKFVCLPVIEPPDLEESEDAADRAMMRVHNRNSSPHHPHYYHHARANRGGGGVAEEEEDGEKSTKKKTTQQQASPPLHYRRTKLNRHHHHSHSDSSDEGGGGGVGSGSAVVAPPSVSIVVSDRGEEEEDDDEEEEEHLKDESGGGGSSNNNCLAGGVIKPSPSCDNNVCGGGSASEEARVKKKRVMFLSWFFKRSKGKRGSNERGGGGGSGSSGANGIYKTRSCAELKSRGCGGSGGSGNQDESVRECFAVCNGGGGTDQSRRKTNKRS